MDYFTRRNEARWISLLALTLAGLGLGVMTLLLSAVTAIVIHANAWIAPGRSAWNFDLVLIVGALVLATAGTMFWRRSARGRAGGDLEARRFGATLSQDPTLVTTVEEFSVAAGMPTPRVHVLEDPGINAFALGVEPTDAVIVVTRGALEELTRAELRALLAHECTRVADGDMQLNLRIAAALQFHLMPSVAARWCARRAHLGRLALTRALWRLPQWCLGLVAIPGYVLARGAKVACWRVRGDGADTNAIVLAGDPHGLTSLLQRTCDEAGACRADVAAPRAIEFDHATLAPIAGVPLGRRAAWRLHASPIQRGRRIGLVHGQLELDVTYAQANLQQVALSTPEVLDQFAEFTAAHGRRAARILSVIPPDVRDALRTPLGAHAVLCALLTRGKTARQVAQRELFVHHGYPPAVLEVRRLHESVAPIEPAVWVALADLAQPALRAMTDEEREHFLADASLLANGNAEALEFFVTHVWLHHARGAGASARLLSRQHGFDRDSWPHTIALLLTIARVGNWDQEVARRAFGDASRIVGVPAGRRIYTQVDGRIVELVENAVIACERLRPNAKRKLVYAALLAMAGNSDLEPPQVEMARAIARSFGCVVAPTLDLAKRADAATPGIRERVLAELWTDERAGISV